MAKDEMERSGRKLSCPHQCNSPLVLTGIRKTSKNHGQDSLLSSWDSNQMALQYKSSVTVTQRNSYLE